MDEPTTHARQGDGDEAGVVDTAAAGALPASGPSAKTRAGLAKLRSSLVAAMLGLVGLAVLARLWPILAPAIPRPPVGPEHGLILATAVAVFALGPWLAWGRLPEFAGLLLVELRASHELRPVVAPQVPCAMTPGDARHEGERNRLGHQGKATVSPEKGFIFRLRWRLRKN